MSGSASVSRRRRQQRRPPAPLPLPALATLDLNVPGERQAHDFLCRTTSKRDRMWSLSDLRRHGGCCCAVRWQYPMTRLPFALAEVSLTETAVHWRDYATAEAAQAELCDAAAEPPAPASFYTRLIAADHC